MAILWVLAATSAFKYSGCWRWTVVAAIFLFFPINEQNKPKIRTEIYSLPKNRKARVKFLLKHTAKSREVSHVGFNYRLWEILSQTISIKDAQVSTSLKTPKFEFLLKHTLKFTVSLIYIFTKMDIRQPLICSICTSGRWRCTAATGASTEKQKKLG